MKSVHVFCRIDSKQNLLGIDLRRQRKLNQNAVNLITAIQVGDQRQQLVGGHLV